MFKYYAILLLILSSLNNALQAGVLENDVNDQGKWHACQEPRPQICTMQYLPVCGKQVVNKDCTGSDCKDSFKTYGNACAACAKPEVATYRQGPCKDDGQGVM